MITPAADAESREFTGRLLAAHANESPQLAAVRRWKPGSVDDGVLALTGVTAADRYPYLAVTAKLFAIWIHGRRTPWLINHSDGVGRWARQLGVKNSNAQRLMRHIVAADDLDELVTALAALAAKRTRRPPNWETVLAEILLWSDPSTRSGVRFEWARSFYRYIPAEPTAPTQPEAPRLQEQT